MAEARITLDVMLIGTIRYTEIRTVDIEGESLADIAAKAAAATPDRSTHQLRCGIGGTGSRDSAPVA